MTLEEVLYITADQKAQYQKWYELAKDDAQKNYFRGIIRGIEIAEIGISLADTEFKRNFR